MKASLFTKRVIATLGDDSSLTAQNGGAGGSPLHRSIRKAIHPRFGPDASDVSLWEWKIVREFLGAFWSLLDEEASRREGRPIAAIVWADPQKRASSEIVDLLHSVEGELPSVPEIHVRPKGWGVPQEQKTVAAISVTFSVLVEAEIATYGDVLSAIREIEGDDEAVLSALDEKAFSLSTVPETLSTRSLIPRETARALTKLRKLHKEMEQELTFSGFVSQLEAKGSLRGKSEREILMRLTELAPEAEPKKNDEKGSIYYRELMSVLGSQ